MLYHGTKYTAGEAQYPYDRELPDEYWKELKKPDPYIRYRSQHPIPPATKRTDVWIACLLIAVVVGALTLFFGPSLVGRWRSAEGPTAGARKPCAYARRSADVLL